MPNEEKMNQSLAARQDEEQLLWPLIVHALRGRWWVAVMMSLVACLCGGLILYFAMVPSYQSAGMIRLSPDRGSVFGGEANDMSSESMMGYLASQVEDIKHGEVVGLTLADDQVREALGSGVKGENNFKEGLMAENPLMSPLIKIEFVHEDPHVAQHVVDRVINSYIELRMSRLRDQDNHQIVLLGQRRDSLLNQRESIRELILRLKEQISPSSVKSLHDRYEKRVDSLNYNLSSLKIQLAGIKSVVLKNARDEAKANDGAKIEVNPATLAVNDLVLSKYLDQVSILEIQLGKLEDKFTDVHPDVIADRDQIRQLRFRIAGHLKKHYPEGKAISVSAETAMSWKEQVESLETQISRAELLRVEAEDKMVSVAKDIHDETPKQRLDNELLNIQLKQVNGQISQLDTRIARLKLEKGVQNLVEVVSTATLPIKPLGKGRMGKAIIGGALGLVFGFGVIVLIGIRDKRCFYPDQAVFQMSEIPVLGVVPRLKIKTAENRAIGLVGHCIQGIRSRLEFGGLGTEKKTLMVASAGQGDGKSDVAFSLAMSFSAAGSRTLLIDFDMDSFALSDRVRSLRDETVGLTPLNGLSDAINGANLMDAVDQTDISNLCVLMSDETNRPANSRLSVNAVKRILCQAEEHFDVILIDGGKLPYGSSASVIASQVDGSMLVVSRKQNYPEIKRSVDCLRQLDTPIAGMVFNYAKYRQVEGKRLADFSKQFKGEFGRNGHSETEPKMGALAMAIAVNLVNDTCIVDSGSSYTVAA